MFGLRASFWAKIELGDRVEEWEEFLSSRRASSCSSLSVPFSLFRLSSLFFLSFMDSNAQAN